jgi:hypothetical protein
MAGRGRRTGDADDTARPPQQTDRSRQGGRDEGRGPERGFGLSGSAPGRDEALVRVHDLATHPEPVLDAFRARLRRPDAGEALRTLADVATPTLARRVAALVREAAQRRPETAVHVAAYVDRRLEHGPSARAGLLPLVTGLLDGGAEQVRAALACVLAAPGTPESRPLRRELFLLTHEHDPSVLIAVLHAAASRGDDPVIARGLVHGTGLLLVRTPQGATHFDRGLVDLGRQVAGFAALVAGWLTEAPQDGRRPQLPPDDREPGGRTRAGVSG